MIIKKYENQEEWKEARRTKITGSKLADIVVLRGKEKKGFYQLIAERLADNRPENENVVKRGELLEPEAVALCEKELKKTFNKDLVMWEREDENCIAISPDAYSDDLKEAVEVKCLCSADHIKAIIFDEYPSEYKYQVYQYFIVNDKLETLHFIMYDPSLTVKQYVRFEINREDIKDEVEKFLEFEKSKIKEVNDIVIKLSF